MHHRSKDKRRVYGRQCEVWLFLLNEVPSSLLCKRLTSSVTVAVVLYGLFLSQWVPVALGISVAWPQSFVRVDDGSKGRGDDYTFHRGCMCLDSFHDTSSSHDRRVEQLLLNVLCIEVKRAGCVKYCFERRIRDYGLVESTRLCDVLNDDEVELVLAIVGVCCLDFVCLFLTSDGADNGVTWVRVSLCIYLCNTAYLPFLEELIESVCSDEATGAYE